MSNFQIITTGIFVALIVIGVGIFSLFGGAGRGGDIGKVEIWGTLDQSIMQAVLTTLAEKDKIYQNAIYTAFSLDKYQDALVNAIASGQGPDLFFISQDNIGLLSDKLQVIPYSVVSQGTYVTSFIDEAQLFLAPQGMLAMPFSIDPLVMYWNRDLFTSAGVAQPPKSWNEFLTLASKLTSPADGQGVRRSAVALGAWDNIKNAKAVLSALFMQTGDFITARKGDTGLLISIFGRDPAGGNAAPAADALRFYTDFANPSKLVYSWNRSMPQAADAFTSGDLAVYFGFASEYVGLAARNPNLHFSIALVPQLENTPTRITYGSMQGLALARGAKNPQGAVVIAQMLSGAEASSALLNKVGLPPVRRDSLPDTSASAALDVVVQSALISRAWADPNKAATDMLFKEMIESVIAGRSDPLQAVHEASGGLQQLLSNQ
ncbi:MAG TPA: extracellular solute-binding protein [Candidatus Paceibacterota bacterium]